jgi:branched-chain amino acid aminotransferase
MKALPIFDFDRFITLLPSLRRPFHDQYFAMYSSVYGGIVTDPVLMQVPVDDHMVHRGDAVFETLSCVDGSLYNVAAHMERLEGSANRIQLSLPLAIADLVETMCQTVRAGGKRDASVRVLVSRGPGSLGVNPYDCPASQLYIIVAAAKPPFMKTHPQGAKLGVSRIPVKPGFFATVKSCNYLPNVLMKKEAVEMEVDFTVSFDKNGQLAEGATENVAIVTPNGVLQTPPAEHVLAATTLLRALTLADKLVEAGKLQAAEVCPISKEAVGRASELLVIGTTPRVTSVTWYDGRAVGDGQPGPVGRELALLLDDDIERNPTIRTPVF